MNRPLTVIALAILLACGPDVESRLDEARQLAREGRFEEMVPLLSALHYEAPEDPEINHLYGLALLRTENAGMAVWPLRIAARATGREVEDGLLLAQALMRGSVPVDAVGALDRVLDRKPGSLEAWTLRATANQSLKRFEERRCVSPPNAASNMIH